MENLESIIGSTLNILTPGVLIAVFSIFMIALAIVERMSVKLFDTFKDFKPTIVSLGILGTFIGIFSGLWYFDTDDISGSVPSLLEGLKVAFVTSIIGMLIASFLTIWEKLSKRAQGDDEAEVMQNMSQSLLDLKENSKGGFSKLHEQMSLLQKQNEDKLSSLVNATSSGFETTNASLKQAIETLSKGATQEIIQALEKVISDFNQNLTEQFGDNFKELNEACLRLVEWQKEYKETMAKSQEQIVQLLDSFERTESTLEKIHRRNEETSNIYDKLETIIKTLDGQIDSMTELLKTYQGISEDAENMFQAIKKKLNETSSYMGEFAATIKQTVDEQSAAFGKLTENMKTQTDSMFQNMRDGLNATNSEMEKFTTDMQKSINDQSSTLNELTQKLRNELEASLQSLEKSLTALTEKFAENYQAFLERAQELPQVRHHEEE